MQRSGKQQALQCADIDKSLRSLLIHLDLTATIPNKDPMLIPLKTLKNFEGKW